ncbi:MAG TPA: hypothetical protein VMF31_10125 [Solirubrobacterales bacterium]|nr:hypothetical protein [Solirubrobacterales bacterium]
MRAIRLSALALTIACAVLVTACGETDTETPAGCFVPAASFASSLRQAPGEVLLDAEVPISGCLVRNQKEGDLLNFGETAVKVATETGAAISEPGPDGIKAAIDAGYLLGAIEKGAEDSEGIHSTLVERVRSAATNGLDGASEFKRSHFEAGREAGRDIG